MKNVVNLSMKNFNKYFLLLSLVIFSLNACKANEGQKNTTSATAQSIYDFTLNDIDGKPVSLSAYKGKVVVIVNTASQCGLVGQLGEIQKFYEKYKDKGVVVLGFPANNFLGQEPLNNADIKTFCSKNYGVTFPMFEKISVKGDGMHPLYKYLTEKAENGITDAPVKWNYQKFIIDKNGHVVCAISPRTTVNDQEFIQNIDDLLK